MKKKDHEVVFAVPSILVFKGIKTIMTTKNKQTNKMNKESLSKVYVSVWKRIRSSWSFLNKQHFSEAQFWDYVFSTGSSVQFRSVAQSCPTLCEPRTSACQASLSITNSQSWLKLMSIESVMPSNHLILCHTLLQPSVFPKSGSFPVGQFFASGDQSIGVSALASVLPMNIQKWFPLGWTDWISL